MQDASVIQALKYIESSSVTYKVLIRGQIDPYFVGHTSLFEKPAGSIVDLNIRVDTTLDASVPPHLSWLNWLSGCRNLGSLNVSFYPPICLSGSLWTFRDPTRPLNTPRDFLPEEIFSRLESLKVSGLTRHDQYGGVPGSVNHIELSTLKRLAAKGNPSCWWLNPTIVSLREFEGEFDRINGAKYFERQVHDFLTRNKFLEKLDLRDLLRGGELSWLGPVGNSLQSLCLRRGAYDAGYDCGLTKADLVLLGRLLPRLRSLLIYVTRQNTWPDSIATDIATSLPQLEYLTVQLYPPCLRGEFYRSLTNRPDLNQLSEGIVPSDYEHPVATMLLTALAWTHLWKAYRLEHKNRSFSSGSTSRPVIRSLTIEAGDCRRDNRDGNVRNFTASLVESATDAERGIAIVRSLRVERLDRERWQWGNPAKQMKRGAAQRATEAVAVLDRRIWAARLEAEYGPDRPKIRKSDVKDDFGRRRVVDPNEEAALEMEIAERDARGCAEYKGITRGAAVARMASCVADSEGRWRIHLRR